MKNKIKIILLLCACAFLVACGTFKLTGAVVSYRDNMRELNVTADTIYATQRNSSVLPPVKTAKKATNTAKKAANVANSTSKK